jgi:hypothetical protein
VSPATDGNALTATPGTPGLLEPYDRLASPFTEGRTLLYAGVCVEPLSVGKARFGAAAAEEMPEHFGRHVVL